MATPYSAFVIFSVGVFLSNFVFNTPGHETPVRRGAGLLPAVFSGRALDPSGRCVGRLHLGVGTLFSYIAAGKAGAAVSYALGQGAPMVAALWGVFVWKEFKGAGGSVKRLLGLMFLLFVVGLALIVVSGGS